MRDRAETRAAKQQEWAVAGAEARAEREAGQRAVEDRTRRLKALRLALTAARPAKG